MGSMEGAGAPLLNDYKLEFFWKRFPQTLLGGLKLKLGYDAPFYVYLNQVLVFLVPFIFGGIFTLLAEFKIITDVYMNAYIYGGLVVVFVISTQLFSWLMRRNATSLAKFQKNLLSQDDEIDFVSCCGVETVEFTFPAKRFVVNMIAHAVTSGVVCSLMFLYLLPANLAGLFSNTGATVVLYTLGWLTVCISQFSLSSSCPPELAIFRALDTLEIAPLMRPFYVVIFGIIGVLARHYSELVATDKVLHILFPFLPLLWILGILPPLDALFPWLAEQALVFGLGGTPLATDLRLLVMFIISSLVVVMATFISNSTAILIVSACFGFILSMDIFGLVLQAWVKINQGKTLKPIVAEWKMREVLIFVVMLAITGALAAVSSHFSSDASLKIFDAFGVLFMVLLVLVKVLGDIQSVSIFFGLLRNPFYPASIESSREFKKRKKILKYIGLLRQALLCYVVPLLQVAFLSLFLALERTTVSNFAVAIGTVRALRQVWQNTFNSLLEISVVYLTATALGSDVATWWGTAGLGLQLMLVGACRDRLQQLLNKISYMLTLTVTAWTLPKQHHKATIPILLALVILLPVVLAVLGAATILATPLLPLFCLPVFLVGFPRPLRSWPKAASTAAATCPDSVFYKQLTPQVVSTLGITMAMGTLGNPSPGDHYLVRFQDRLIWVRVLECGYKFCTTVLKGLELQETSCHTVEATRVDDVFQDIFVHEGKWPLVSLNQHVANVLCPCDTLILNTYSDAKNVLTGVIDQPENLRRNSENFLKTLVWVLVNYCKDRKFEIPEQTSHQVSIDIAKQEVMMSVEVLPTPKPKEALLVRQTSQDDLDIPNVFMSSTDYQEPTTRVTSPKRRRSSSLPSLSDSVWSQESLKLDESQTSDRKRKQSGSVGGLHVKDEGIDDLDESFNLGGFPALDIGQASASKNKGSSEKLLKKVDPVFSDFNYDVLSYGATKRDAKAGASDYMKPVTFTSEHAHRLDLPHHWKFSIPVDKHNLDSLSEKFPDFWFRHVVKGLNFGNNSKGIAESILSDSTLISFYRQLTCACYAMVEVLGFPGSSAVAAGPGHVHKVYAGDVPWSIHVDWLEKETELKSLILKAYRYAFKLTYDEAVLGEVTSEDELVEYMTEYDRDWYLGSEIGHEWQLSIMDEKPFLFSLGRDNSKGTYTSRVLTKQEIMAPVGRLNGECVRGQWASLALELLYFTNDDEERYSIQAHPTLLRNLTIQAADPPLGYPVYSSGAVSVPIAVAPL